jgi:hypothetical protein
MILIIMIIPPLAFVATFALVGRPFTLREDQETQMKCIME